MDANVKQVLNELYAARAQFQAADEIDKKINQKEQAINNAYKSVGDAPVIWETHEDKANREIEMRKKTSKETRESTRKKNNHKTAFVLWLCTLAVCVVNALYHAFIINGDIVIDRVLTEKGVGILVSIVGFIFGSICIVLSLVEKEWNSKWIKKENKIAAIIGAFIASAYLFYNILSSGAASLFLIISFACLLVVALVLPAILFKDPYSFKESKKELKLETEKDNRLINEAKEKDRKEFENALNSYQKRERDADLKARQLQAEIPELRKQKAEHLRQARQISVIHPDYINPGCVNFLIKELEHGTSGSLKEALQRYEVNQAKISRVQTEMYLKNLDDMMRADEQKERDRRDFERRLDDQYQKNRALEAWDEIKKNVEKLNQ